MRLERALGGAAWGRGGQTWTMKGQTRANRQTNKFSVKKRQTNKQMNKQTIKLGLWRVTLDKQINLEWMQPTRHYDRPHQTNYFSLFKFWQGRLIYRDSQQSKRTDPRFLPTNWLKLANLTFLQSKARDDCKGLDFILGEGNTPSPKEVSRFGVKRM